MTSLRKTTLIWMTVLLSVAGMTALVIAYQSGKMEAREFLDGQLRQIALNVGSGVDEAFAPQSDQDPEDRLSIRIWDAKTGSLLRSTGAELPGAARSGLSLIDYQGKLWRVFYARDEHRIVQVGQNNTVLEEIAQTAGIEAAGPLLIVIPLSWIVLSLSLSYVLRPLTKLSSKLAERDPLDPSPLDDQEAPSEIIPLIRAMNLLARRLQDAFIQQRRFLSDAAHELRTPLAALRLQLDNLADETKAPSKSLDDMKRGLERASSLVDQMLKIARLESSRTEYTAETIDLSALLADCTAQILPLADAKEIDLGLETRTIGRLRGASDDLRLLFSNLIENAVRYTPRGGSVDIIATVHSDAARIDILDTGPGIPSDAMPHIFDRFFRATSQDVPGTGLGLAIAKAVAEKYGLTLSLANRTEESGLRATILIPARLLIQS